MRAIWTDEKQLRIWLQIELLASEPSPGRGSSPYFPGSKRREHGPSPRLARASWQQFDCSQMRSLFSSVQMARISGGNTRIMHKGKNSETSRVRVPTGQQDVRRSTPACVPFTVSPSGRAFSRNLALAFSGVDACREIFSRTDHLVFDKFVSGQILAGLSGAVARTTLAARC